MKKMMALLLALVLVLSGCGAGKQELLKNGDTVGEGAVSFTLSIVDDKDQQIDVTVQTDEEMLGEALLQLHVISGEMGEYGLYIKTVNGVTADYDTDGSYWAFYVNGEYAQQSADLTEIQEGAVYMLRVEKA